MNFRRTSAGKTPIGRAPVGGAGIKYPYLLLSLILFLLASIGIFSSRAQSLFLTNQSKSIEIERPNLFPENPVYGPLARSVHFLSIPSSPGKAAPVDGPMPLEPGFSWNEWSESQWWIPQQQEPSPEVNWLSEGSLRPSQKSAFYGELFPRLQSRDFDPQAIMSNFITMGVADLLEDLGEQQVDGIAGQEAPKANPFEKALKEASNEVAAEPEKAVENKESDSSKSDSTQSDSTVAEDTGSAEKAMGGGGSSRDCKLLFIGSFGGQPLATAVGTVQPGLLHQSQNDTVFIEIEGAEKQSFDLDMIFRNRDNQESVAFGDLDLDGFTDMVVTNRRTDKTNIFKGDGQGNFKASGEIYGGIGPTAAAIGDFNADGSSDIAVLLPTNKRIVVDGKGLRKLVYLPTSSIDEEFTSILPYDFNSDGLTDLLLSNYGNLTASIYLNRGQALFAVSDSFALQSFPYLRSLVDLDADGIEDAVYIQCLGSNISVEMVNGKSGTVRNLGNMSLDPSLYFVLGDFNLDGVVDIALAHRR